MDFRFAWTTTGLLIYLLLFSGACLKESSKFCHIIPTLHGIFLSVCRPLSLFPSFWCNQSTWFDFRILVSSFSFYSLDRSVGTAMKWLSSNSSDILIWRGKNSFLQCSNHSTTCAFPMTFGINSRFQYNIFEFEMLRTFSSFWLHLRSVKSNLNVQFK